MIAPVGLNPFSVGKLVENVSPQGAGSGSGSAGGGGFAKMLSNSINSLDQAQTQADQQTQALATGKATDLSSVVMSVEKASLDVQLATQVRDKAVDAYKDIFQMQV
jgi:flagellar hook-basal body complex protein FliE